MFLPTCPLPALLRSTRVFRSFVKNRCRKTLHSIRYLHYNHCKLQFLFPIFGTVLLLLSADGWQGLQSVLLNTISCNVEFCFVCISFDMWGQLLQESLSWHGLCFLTIVSEATQHFRAASWSQICWRNQHWVSYRGLRSRSCLFRLQFQLVTGFQIWQRSRSLKASVPFACLERAKSYSAVT